MAKVNKIFKIDIALLPTFILLVITGVGIHIAYENGNHDSWHRWSVAHVICCLIFIILIYYHVKQHIGWYKTLLKAHATWRGPTILLSLVMILETLSGIALIGFVDGEGSDWGHFHWVVGLILAIIGTGHFIKRFGRLRKGLGLRP